MEHISESVNKIVDKLSEGQGVEVKPIESILERYRDLGLKEWRIVQIRELNKEFRGKHGERVYLPKGVKPLIQIIKTDKGED